VIGRRSRVLQQSDWQHVPLFPLSQPLYPGVSFRLRIFEQRYLRLVRESVSRGTPFAVVPIISGREVGAPPEFYPWGTLVNIMDWEQQPDGLLGITIRGDRRARVRGSEVEKDGLIVAQARVSEADDSDRPGRLYDDLQQLLEELVAGLEMDSLFPDEPLTLASLGWRLATILPLQTSIKMRLLAEDDARERLAMIRQGIADMVGE